MQDTCLGPLTTIYAKAFARRLLERWGDPWGASSWRPRSATLHCLLSVVSFPPFQPLDKRPVSPYNNHRYFATRDTKANTASSTKRETTAIVFFFFSRTLARTRTHVLNVHLAWLGKVDVLGINFKCKNKSFQKCSLQVFSRMLYSSRERLQTFQE